MLSAVKQSITIVVACCDQDSDFAAVSLYLGSLDVMDEAWTAADLSDDGERCRLRPLCRSVFYYNRKCVCSPCMYSLCVCVFSSRSFWTSISLDVPAGVTQEEGHTGFLIHLLSAVRALYFFSREGFSLSFTSSTVKSNFVY